MRALIISTDLFEDPELRIPCLDLQASGLDVDIASLKKGRICGKHGWCTEAGLTLDEIDPERYDMLLLPGGKAPSVLRKEPKVLQIVRDFFGQGKLVAAICHGPQILNAYGLSKGRKMTAYMAVAPDVKACGAEYVDQEVVVDGNLVTSRAWPDLPAFMREFLKLLGA